MRDDRERLIDMQEAITRIERYTSTGRSAFDQNELIQGWVVLNLERIGEAARAMSDVFRQQHPDIPWTNIIGMRTILTHLYFNIDVDVVWAVVASDLPSLKMQIAAALQETQP